VSTLTNEQAMPDANSTATFLRRGLLALATLTLVGIALELITERH